MGRSNSSHRFLRHWLHRELRSVGFHVLQVSSPDRHQLGRAWVEPRGFVVSEVSWIVRLEEIPSSEVSCLCLFLFLFSIGFRKIRFGLGSVMSVEQLEEEEVLIRLIHGQTIFPGTSTFLIPASKLYKTAARRAVALIAQKSAQHQKGCAGPPCCRNNCWPP